LLQFLQKEERKTMNRIVAKETEEVCWSRGSRNGMGEREAELRKEGEGLRIWQKGWRRG
jgi:hypothetical protein